MKQNKGLIIYALEEEFVPIELPQTHLDYVFSGIGKTRASMTLTKAIIEYEPDFVLNIGTAGSIHQSIGDIIVCQRFIDRDLEPLIYNGVIAEIDFSTKLYTKNSPIQQILNNFDNSLKTCNTGDRFITNIENIKGDVVDMEAFAHAVVCESFKIPYLSIKYVTDIIGQNSIKDWENKLNDAKIGFSQWFKILNNPN